MKGPNTSLASKSELLHVHAYGVLCDGVIAGFIGNVVMHQNCTKLENEWLKPTAFACKSPNKSSIIYT